MRYQDSSLVELQNYLLDILYGRCSLDRGSNFVMAYLHTPCNHTDNPWDLPLKHNIWFSFLSKYEAEVYNTWKQYVSTNWENEGDH